MRFALAFVLALSFSHLAPSQTSGELQNPLKIKMTGKIPHASTDGHRYVKAGKVIDDKTFVATILFVTPSGLANVPGTEKRVIVVIKGIPTEGIATGEMIAVDGVMQVTGTTNTKAATRFVLEPVESPKKK